MSLKGGRLFALSGPYAKFRAAFANPGDLIFIAGAGRVVEPGNPIDP